MTLLTMLLIPTLVALGFFIFSKHKVTLIEFGAQLGIQTVVMGLVLLVTNCSQYQDTEVWNGVVAKKTREKVSCSHSYPCNPHPCMCDDKGSCSTCWDTCYEHSYDVSWYVYANFGGYTTINRIDRRGLDEPPRWTAVQIGEPYSETRSYENYIKANPDSLFNYQGLAEKYQGQLPSYPARVYDYYKLDRIVLLDGVQLENVKGLSEKLSKMNGELGPVKKVNMVLVVVKNRPEEYFYALQHAWIGGKKNDVITVINVDDNNNISWVEVMAWTKDFMVQTVIKDEVVKLGSLNGDAILTTMRDAVSNHYVRKPMEEFEYLKDATRISFTGWIISMIIGLIVSVVLGIIFLMNDEQYYSHNRRFPWR